VTGDRSSQIVFHDRAHVLLGIPDDAYPLWDFVIGKVAGGVDPGAPVPRRAPTIPTLNSAVAILVLETILVTYPVIALTALVLGLGLTTTGADRKEIPPRL
jgi:hypothetical protein